MIKLNFSYVLLLFLVLSCSSEKINLSPIEYTTSETSDKPISYTLEERKNLVYYSSELSNLIASFPKFKIEAINKEAANLKYYIKDYIGAMEEQNKKGLINSQKKFENSYKKLQQLRKYLTREDDEILNRYLVQIKINMSQLNSSISKDSLSKT